MIEFANTITNSITSSVGILTVSMLLGYIPQSASYIMFVFSVGKERFNSKQFIFTLTIFSLATMAVRALPISFGVHSILNLLILIIVMFVNQIKVPVAFLGSIISTVYLSLLEIIFLLVVRNIDPQILTYINSSGLIRSIFCLPITLVFLVTSIITYTLRTGRVKTDATACK